MTNSIKEIVVPKLGMSQGAVTLIQWSRNDGEAVSEGETVAVIETSKVSYDIPSPADGLMYSLIPVGSKAAIGQVIGVVADSQDAFNGYQNGKDAPESLLTQGDSLFDDPDDRLSGGVELVFGDGSQSVVTTSSSASPNVSTSAMQLEPPPQVRIDLSERRIKTRMPFAGMRRTIADNLIYSLHSGAQLTIFAQADLTELTAFRQELKLDRSGANITFVDMLVKLLPAALSEHPILNSALVDNDVICWDEYHIGVAVALEAGLVVPVVKNADQKSLVAVSREIKKLARLARAGELQPEDYQGGTFTLSSGGPVEIEFVTPIINPPENAILGLGKIAPRPVVINGELAVRTTVWLCLTHDHRIIDGVPAAMFIGRLKELIETPSLFRKIIR